MLENPTLDSGSAYIMAGQGFFGGYALPFVFLAMYVSLVISGGGVSLTEQAVYEGFTATPELNGVTRYTVTLRLLDG